MTDSPPKPGYYFGTEINSQWWRRYRKHNMFARGKGEYWLDAQGFSFARFPRGTPFTIALQDVLACTSGRWHGGKWGGGLPVVKILWHQDGQTLSSGFLLAKDRAEVAELIHGIQQLAALAQASSRQPPTEDNEEKTLHRQEYCWSIINNNHRSRATLSPVVRLFYLYLAGLILYVI